MDDVHKLQRLWVKASLNKELQKDEYSGVICADEKGDQGLRKEK